MENTEIKSIPLFTMTTAYKTILSFQRKENTIDALFVYLHPGRRITVVFGDSFTDLGIEEYRFANSEYCNDWYNLLHKIKDYELFLNQEVYENAFIAKIAKPYIDAFDARYSENKKSFFKRLKDNRKLSHVETRPVNMHAFSANTMWSVKSERKFDDLVGIENCEPIFNTCAVFNQNMPEVYVYELRLIKAENTGVYEQGSCIDISLFKDAKKADNYYKNSVREVEKFKTHPEYARLAEKNYPAIQRFEKYMKIR